jgi:hypothetical protein
MKLTIAVSTLNSNVSKAINIFKNLLPDPDFSLVIVCQGANEEYEQIIDTENGCKVRVLYFRSKGLSRSRNIILGLVDSGYIWFLDDDVEIAADALGTIRLVTEKVPAPVMLGQISCSDCKGMYKDYRSSRSGIRGALRASSIEVIVDIDFITKNRISFDERLGLGAKYPSGEENAFLLEIVRKGGKIVEIGVPIVKHPCLQQERNPSILWSNHNILIAKGLLSSKAGVAGILIMFYLMFKISITTKSLSSLYFVPKGFIMGIRGG